MHLQPLLITLFAVTGVLNAVVARADTVDDYVRAQLAAQNIPGLSLAVIRDGTVIKANGYGLANLETQTPASVETVYPLCSVTKQFVAAGILLLERDGKLSVEDSVGKYLEYARGNWSGVTLKHLLTMTSGIKDYVNDPLTPGGKSLSETRDFPKSDTSADEILRRVAVLPLGSTPGEKFSYSNTNYIALARIITQLSGKPWHEFLAERIFKPLGMTRTGYDDPRALMPQRAGRYDVVTNLRSHEWRNSDWVNPTFWWQGGAGIVSSVADMAKWDAALRRERILGSSDLRRMRDPQRLSTGLASSYGLGWNTDEYENHARMWHSGSVPGGSINFTRFDDGKISVIVMANTSADLDAIAIDVAGMFEPALAHPSFVLSSTLVSARAGNPVNVEARAVNWGKPAEGFIVIEIRSPPYGRDDVVGKHASAQRKFEPGETVSGSFSWTPPTAAEFRVYIGVFAGNWSQLYAWKNAASVILAK